MPATNSTARNLNSVAGKSAQFQGSRSLRALDAPQAVRCHRKFLRFFPDAFRDETYLDWERNYKWNAHQQWNHLLGFTQYRDLLHKRKFSEIASWALKVESRTNLLFSFEKMAIRDAVKSPAGAKAFAAGLFQFLYGPGTPEAKFEAWRDVVAALPRKQTRVLTWPVLTVFSFIAHPDTHIFLKPNVTRIAAEEYGFEFQYHSRPSWKTYASILKFAEVVRKNLRDLRPRDMIDLQSFIWVLGSDEYEER
ncbi:MAG TPA: hypothetical protein VH350_16715 [Candidatus Sulfotelmatobacter sp.]|nr:hypothetical protein [Candidatus Sulfotelmatobacter sp.]